jgi:hypothetical protein
MAPLCNILDNIGSLLSKMFSKNYRPNVLKKL